MMVMALMDKRAKRKILFFMEVSLMWVKVMKSFDKPGRRYGGGDFSPTP
jgi:hypothetical protein